MKLDDFYQLVYSDFIIIIIIIIHNILADVSFSLLQVKTQEPTKNYKLNLLFNLPV